LKEQITGSQSLVYLLRSRPASVIPQFHEHLGFLNFTGLVGLVRIRESGLHPSTIGIPRRLGLGNHSVSGDGEGGRRLWSKRDRAEMEGGAWILGRRLTGVSLVGLESEETAMESRSGGRKEST